ncbi:FAD-binding oxidoreductase [Rhizobium grahamii]|uniref:Oxidoreductase n=1 Tax=Rhizobium grahamii CCGE 502 TaxID=990285 RepID=S3HKI4_9HYPH|nr:FAD-binding oxidoreductase [Rhizobium grahamii]EPE93996.1 oxidoreductase [Rhizobium grahamii CCGE 502]
MSNLSDNEFLTSLRTVLGDELVLTGDRVPEKAISDASQTGRNLPQVYVRPRSVKDISETLKICNVYRRPVVVQGGMTGLSGGANPQKGDVAISMELIAGVEDIDTAAGTMTVLSGTVLEQAQKEAERAGFLLPIDLGARGSCHIGGNLATNAGGIRVITHGMARDNVLGLEVVLADGTVISSLNHMLKNNTGYDLKQLFIGSEGTLGIITRAVVKLKPLPSVQATALCGLNSYDNVVSLLRHAKRSLSGLSAFEVMWEPFFRFSRQGEGHNFFEVDYSFTVIVEQSGESTDLEAFLESMFEEGLISDALIAQSEMQREAFWKVREGRALRALTDRLSFDISLPIRVLDVYVQEVSATLVTAFPGVHISVFGHVADNNIHLYVSTGNDDPSTKERVTTIVYERVRQHRGSISAEHGIGLLKRDYLSYSRNADELELMRLIKKTLDPNQILNPGKVI